MRTNTISDEFMRADDVLVSSSAVREMLGGISDTTLWRRIQDETFPRPKYIARRRYWRLSAIDAWIEEQPEG